MIAKLIKFLPKPGYFWTAGILLVCAIFLQVTVHALSIHFKKLPVQLSEGRAQHFNSLREGIPERIGHWMMVSKDGPINPDIEHTLRTTEYIFRDYVDDRAVALEDIEFLRTTTYSVSATAAITNNGAVSTLAGISIGSPVLVKTIELNGKKEANVIAAGISSNAAVESDRRVVSIDAGLRTITVSLTEEQRSLKLAKIRNQNPSAVIRAAVTYYTGLVDTVAHVPERCFVADGFEISSSDLEKPTLVCSDKKTRTIEYRFLGFEDQAVEGRGTTRQKRNVAYFFHCNGDYTSDSLVVRGRLQNLLEKYGYYAKVELMTAIDRVPGQDNAIIETNSQVLSKKAMEDFLAAALPEIEKCMPDWDAVHARK